MLEFQSLILEQSRSSFTDLASAGNRGGDGLRISSGFNQELGRLSIQNPYGDNEGLRLREAQIRTYAPGTLMLSTTTQVAQSAVVSHGIVRLFN